MFIYLIRVLAATIIILSDAAVLNRIFKRDIEFHSLTIPVPWLGVLIFKEDGEGTKSTTDVILISDKLAIGNARDMEKIKRHEWDSIKQAITIMFMTAENRTWYARVMDISLHPEFNDETLTTIALLKLQYHNKFTGDMPIWPTVNSPILYSNDELFTIGYTDRNFILEQTIYRMDYVNMNDCHRFYDKEGLDSVWMRPKEYHCYKVRYSKNTCVFDPGLALIQYSAGKWTLLGMSTWGPGCSLPARFVDFEYFVPWILTKMTAERRGLFEEKDPSEHTDLDIWSIERINDTRMVLRPLPIVKNGQPQELIHGECNDEDIRDGKLIYRDQMNFTTVKHKYAQAVYTLSFYHQKFNRNQYRCIMINTWCSMQSDSKLWYTKTFQRPQFTSFMTNPYKEDKDPLIYHMQEDWPKYSFDTIKMDIINLIFRFDFQTVAYFDIYFYGNLTDYVMTTTKGLEEPISITTVNYFPTPEKKKDEVNTARNLKDDNSSNYWRRWWNYQQEVEK